MNKIWIIPILGVVIFALLVGFYANVQTNREYNKVNYVLKIPTKQINPLEEVERIAYTVAHEREYQYQVYDCTSFSRTLVRRLTEKGYNATCVYGYYIENSVWHPLHDWVLLYLDNKEYPIEATGGYFIDENTYNERYRIIKIGVCP